jgi:hypothetical protein
VDLVPPAVRSSRNVNVQASHISITAGVAPKNVLDSVGGRGKMVRWRVTGLGVLENKIWAASVEPVPKTEKVVTLSRPYSIVLAMGSKAQPKDINFIRDWTSVAPNQAVEFDTVVGEKCLLNIVVETNKRNVDSLGANEDFVTIDGPPAPQSRRQKWQNDHQQASGNGNNYRGGNTSRGRGPNRRDETGQRNRGRGGARGGSGRGRGRGPGFGNERREGGGDHRPGEWKFMIWGVLVFWVIADVVLGGYTDYDANPPTGRNDGNGAGGMYNAY